MTGERWIEYLDKKKLVFLTKVRLSVKSTTQKSYVITVPIEWIRNIEDTPKVRVTLEVLE